MRVMDFCILLLLLHFFMFFFVVYLITKCLYVTGVSWENCSQGSQSSRPRKSLPSWSWSVEPVAPHALPTGLTSSNFHSSMPSSLSASIADVSGRNSHCELSSCSLALSVSLSLIHFFVVVFCCLLKKIVVVTSIFRYHWNLLYSLEWWQPKTDSATFCC